MSYELMTQKYKRAVSLIRGCVIGSKRYEKLYKIVMVLYRDLSWMEVNEPHKIA